MKSFDKAASNRSVFDYLQDNNHSENKTILVEVNGTEVFNLKNVQVGAECNSYNGNTISVFWEDNGLEDYKKYGLFGKYNADFDRITYKGANLVINSRDNIDITIYS